MKLWVKIILAMLFALHLLVISAVAEEPGKVTSMVPQDVLVDYIQYLGGRDPLAITSYGGPHSRRDVVELVLSQQVLHRGGMKVHVEFIPGPSYPRILEQVRMGRVDMTSTSAWLSDLRGMKGSVTASHALVENGTFEAGLYTAVNNKKALAVRSVEQLRALLVISNKDWKPDWKALKALKLPRLIHLHKWEVMVRAVSSMRGDVLLAPFQSNPDFVLHTKWGTLIPVPEIKMGLHGSRHFFVHTGTEQGQKVYAALNRGLEELIAAGVVQQAYQDCGFFNASTRSWKRLN